MSLQNGYNRHYVIILLFVLHLQSSYPARVLKFSTKYYEPVQGHATRALYSQKRVGLTDITHIVIYVIYLPIVCFLSFVSTVHFLPKSKRNREKRKIYYCYQSVYIKHSFFNINSNFQIIHFLYTLNTIV